MSRWTTIATIALAVFAAAAGCGGNGHGGDAGHGDAIADGDGGSGDAVEQNCGELIAVLRDFKASHPDMELADYGPQLGLVEVDLGPDDKPVYAPDGPTWVTAGEEYFDQWYRDVDGVNMHFEIPIVLTETTPSVYVFEDGEFFPLDGQGWPDEEMNGHNYHFTTEIHGTFKYEGGEVFTFTGDDDVFAFVNRKLAIDLGGVHGSQSSTIDFDARASDLGISVGNVYQLDVFHAERHTVASHFRIETSIDCLVIE